MSDISRETWAREVREALDGVEAAIKLDIGEAPQAQFGTEISADVVRPRFVFPPDAVRRLENAAFTRGKPVGTSSAEVSKAVRRQWERARDAAPHLWSYQAWCEDRVRRGGTLKLGDDQFAERMRQRRAQAGG